MESVHVSSTPPSSFMYFPKLCPPISTFSPVLPFYLIQINIVYISNLLPVACCHLLFFLSPLHAFYYHHMCLCFLSLSYSLSLSLLALFYISSTHSSNSVLLQSFFAKRFQQTFSISISQNKNDRGIYR